MRMVVLEVRQVEVGQILEGEEQTLAEAELLLMVQMGRQLVELEVLL